MTLKLNVGFSNNPRLQPLIDGTVKPQNIELNFVITNPAELFLRNLKYDEFDLTEMSISETLITRERRSGTRWDWSALPVFLSKAFFWFTLYVNTGSGIEGLGDLKGKRVGIPDYPMTAALWMRAVLKDLYGIEPGDISWYNGRVLELSHSGSLGLDKNPPPGVSLKWLSGNQTMDIMLDRAELDAAYGFLPAWPRQEMSFSSIDRYGGTPISGNPRIRKLFEDKGKQVTTEYYQKTGILPANHMVIVQNRILREYPWAALELYKAFQQAKEIAYERARGIQSTYLLFDGKDFREQAAAFGEDPYPLGIQANRKMLEKLFRSSLEQGLTGKLARIEDVFYASTLDT